ncbi:right-handed parallel beta-helix repeat-containing protein [Flavobacterium sp. NG2]|uniref:alpha-1,3-galactosidase-related protein n=1 Tax=Flavobacterium sp. NG2 TaxID=3097547 RepID=UPI002A7F4631|nr:right-handed parallel beta-helix repeat-containing protein [Flavobacterium sp. NG2]WPR71348.1 right-handed parallel beta-helix repeat-containing protein [Flavobacterium sp. NG2]
MINRNPQFIALLFFFLLSCSYTGISQTRKGNTVFFETSIAADATPAVLAQFMKADAKSISEIKFEKGTYHFYPDKGFEIYAQLSNHNNGLAKTAFPIFNMKNLTIDGQGATFIFHGIIIPFSVENSENIKIVNVAVDWAMSFHSEAKIVAVDPVKKTFDMQISDDYPYEIRNGQLHFIKEYYEHNIGQSILFDPKTTAISFDTESYTSLTTRTKTKIQNNVKNIKYKYNVDPRSPENFKVGMEDKLVVEQLKPGLLRVYNHGRKIPEVGKILTMKGEQGQNRFAPAFHVVSSKNFEANNVNVHHACGMGIIVENSENLTLDNFNVTPSQGRMVSTTADATHFVGCRGKITIKNCTFNNQLDDAVNVHGTYQQVEDILGENSIGIKVGHYQQQGFSIGVPGDVIGLVNLHQSFFEYDKLTLKSIEKINSRYHIITFNEKVPASLKAGDYIENMSAYPELLVQNCTISKNRARGLLLSTPRKIVVENNYFATEMEAILVPVESGYWYESGSALDLTIRNNTFQDCNIGGQNRGIIRFETDDESKNIAFKNILIENNKINQFDNLILEVNNTDGLKFKGNTITNSGTFKMLFPENPAFSIKTSKNIIFENNKYSGKANPILKSDGSVPNLKFK